ncbi:MAG TPA: BadF/BadG/BcrA/BcrD ATPase family protein [Candidatus Krumholzibacteria bacterium]|nr:BadF/BadG/BcrA/BcrD ATPase family protein [Candidatus Krumholzibacteria bacterium]
MKSIARIAGAAVAPAENAPAATCCNSATAVGTLAATTVGDPARHVASGTPSATAMICGIDVGSTTCKYLLATSKGETVAQAYERHNTRQAEKVLEFLRRLEQEHGLTAGRDHVFFTGSGAGLIAPLVGGKIVQEVVAVAAAVERLHPAVSFVSEIGGEDMKTIFFTGQGSMRSKQVLMQSACSGGTGTFVEKTARKLDIPIEQLSDMRYTGHTLHKVSSKCGIFAEADSNTLLKAGVPVEEIIASLFEAVVYQNLSSLTRGNTPLPQILLLGGPNLFFKGLQEAWRHHLTRLWEERKIELPAGTSPEDAILVPQEALYYAALGCVETGMREPAHVGLYSGADKLQWWIEVGQHEEKKKSGRGGLWTTTEELEAFKAHYGEGGSGNGQTAGNGNGSNGNGHEAGHGNGNGNGHAVAPNGNGHAVASNGNGANGNGHGHPVAHVEQDSGARSPVETKKTRVAEIVVGCDFGSTTAKAVCLGPDKEIVFSCYALSKGNPIEDAKSLFQQIEAGIDGARIAGLGITGYGKDLLKTIVGADCAVVETIAHASAGLRYFPDADCICDVGGVDVKIMILRNGTVSDFRLNSQCSSGNGAFLQGVAERFGIPLTEMADGAFRAEAVPQLSMGCGVFLQSDIVNQQRKGWQAEEILGGLCAILPLNVWIYAGGLNNVGQAGRKFILQGGTHKNLAVVKTQVDFLKSKVPDAEIFVHPYSGEAGAIGAALVALDWWENGGQSAFRGFDTIQELNYKTTTSTDTVCHWCPVNCQRSFIDVELEGGGGREWSNVKLERGWERVIVNNSCPKGLVEDANEMRVIKTEMEKTRHDFPNVADLVRKDAFRRVLANA